MEKELKEKLLNKERKLTRLQNSTKRWLVDECVRLEAENRALKWEVDATLVLARRNPRYGNFSEFRYDAHGMPVYLIETLDKKKEERPCKIIRLLP